MNFLGWKIQSFWAKKWMETLYLLITKKLVFWTFREWEICFFWDKKLMERWYLPVNEKFLFWTFREWEIRSSFEAKSWRKEDIYWLLERSCFELFGDGKYGIFWDKKLMEKWYLLITEKFLFWTFWWWEIRSFFSQKVDVKIIFTWSFWAFHDIPGPGKYCFSCSEIYGK